MKRLAKENGFESFTSISQLKVYPAKLVSKVEEGADAVVTESSNVAVAHLFVHSLFARPQAFSLSLSVFLSVSLIHRRWLVELF